jgi:hypothetical protein
MWEINGLAPNGRKSNYGNWGLREGAHNNGALVYEIQVIDIII